MIDAIGGLFLLLLALLIAVGLVILMLDIDVGEMLSQFDADPYPTLKPQAFPGQERFPESLYPDGPPKDFPNATWIPTEIESMQPWKRTQIAIQGTVFPYEKEGGE